MMHTMNGRWHIGIAVVVFHCLWVVGHFWVSALNFSYGYVWFLSFATLLPDTDLKWNSHRNVFYHSILIPCLLLVDAEWTLLKGLLILSFGLHCICDIKIRKTTGFYLLHLYKQKRAWSYHQTTHFLTVNFLASVALLIAYVFFIY